MIYNKLVRDKIPQIIEQKGKQPIYRKLNDAEMKEALKAKLVEETQEVVNAETKEQMLEEIADITTVLIWLMGAHGITTENVQQAYRKKAIEKGLFYKGYFLEEVKEQ